MIDAGNANGSPRREGDSLARRAPGQDRARADDDHRLRTVLILTAGDAGTCRNVVFQDADVFASFGLPSRLEAQRLRVCTY